MRISSSMTYTNFLNNYQVNANTMQGTLDQLASGKVVNKASDNPLLVSKIMDSKVALANNAAYADTIADAKSWTENQYSVLNQVTKSMNRIITLITAAASSTNGIDELTAQKHEINQDLQNIVDSLNTSYGGKYIFAGKNTDTRPFEMQKDANGVLTGISYGGTKDGLPREISAGVTVDLFADGSKFMQVTDKEGQTTNLTDFVANLMNALGNNPSQSIDQAKLGTELLSQAQAFYDNFTTVQTTVSAKETRLQAAASRNETEKTNLSTQLSDEQDVDYAEAYMHYQNQMVAYKATLAVGTKILQTTVLDYMR